jgi:ADP-ribose pyrophosphatase YjhB (NUDIX family)
MKRSIALLIRSEEKFLSVRRADNDDELPGVWGLPAGSFRGTETLNDLVMRIVRDKLGVVLKPGRKLAHGRQERPQYILDMELWEAEIASGTITHEAWQWATPEILISGALQGSLCCRLAADTFRN